MNPHSTGGYPPFIEQIKEGFLVLDKGFAICYCNKRIRDLTGQGMDELMGCHIWVAFPEMIGSAVHDALLSAGATQAYTQADSFVPTLDMWLRFHIYPTTEDYTICIRDVTTTRMAIEQLRHERSFTESILSSLPGIFYMYDTSGRFLHWNQNFETVSGYTATEIERMHPLDFFTDEEKPMLQQKIGEVFESESSFVEANFLTRSGERVPYYFTGRAIEYNGVRCLLGVGIDIAERRRSEEALVRSEEQYRYLFNNNPALIIIWDPEAMRVLEVNDAVYSLYGYTREEYMNMSVLHYRPAEDHERILAFARQMLSGQARVARGTWRHIKKDGSLIYVDISSHRIDYNGRIAVLSLAKDITDQHRAEEQLRNSYDDIRRLNAHLQSVREEERLSVAREIHDELGQQLTGLKMDISWLSRRLGSAEDVVRQRLTEVQALIDTTIRTVRRIASDLRPGILEDLGLVAALESQSAEFHRRTGISSILEISQQDTDLSRDLAIVVFRVYQEALTNITRHAQATEVRTTMTCTDGILTMTIADNGRGMDVNQVRSGKTFGLVGMAERAAMLQGSLTLDSSPGRGTTLTISIPLHPTTTV
ncbi:MAG: PAS domain S-box protein [Bacteroidetes bacterium]|nr:PAS domain S-box protein [Bacteroidota bacterium]